MSVRAWSRAGRDLSLIHIFASYQRQKSLRSLLDYDDLIARTRSLLERVEAAWVLYKLDAGIDHILLDEAQDLSLIHI